MAKMKMIHNRFSERMSAREKELASTEVFREGLLTLIHAIVNFFEVY